MGGLNINSNPFWVHLTGPTNMKAKHQHKSIKHFRIQKLEANKSINEFFNIFIEAFKTPLNKLRSPNRHLRDKY